MKVLVIGSGGREHAIIRAIKKSELNPEVYVLPGNEGMADDAILLAGESTDIPNIVDTAISNKIDYVIVTPDNPLSLGAVDALNKVGIPCFGPTKSAARIESSKAFSKELMKRNRIPTADFEVFISCNEAIGYIKDKDFPLVIKADGLALGKGVIIAKNFDEAKKAITELMVEKKFGKSGEKIVIEEYLTGPEVSILALTDGKNLLPLISSMDYKKSKDNDDGLNTGGMGCIAPNPYYTKEIAKKCEKEIFHPTIKAMNDLGTPFSGCLYFGLMITDKGVKVIEYNARFGDPETQTILPLLKSDLLKLMIATTQGTLDKEKIEFSPYSSVSVSLTSRGYPEGYEKGYPISIKETDDIIIYHAGVGKNGKELVTAGGRVNNVVSVKETLKEAISSVYKAINEGIVSFEGMSYRTDIGKKALEAFNGKENIY